MNEIDVNQHYGTEACIINLLVMAAILNATTMLTHVILLNEY